MTISSLSAAATTAGAELFKDAFRAHPAGVAVVTATGTAGPVGLTASSVASVSADPPALAFSVSDGRTASRLAEAQTVVVHLMGAEQVDLVRVFSTRGAPRFTDQMDWELLDSGEPLLRAAPWALRCEISHRVPVGGSVLIAATVLEVRTGTGSGDPLVYHDRAFHRLGHHSRLP